jgi:hypothetical protein
VHATHAPLAPSQIGFVVVVQSALVTHSTHVRFEAQIDRGAAQLG